MTVRELLARIDSRELTEWAAYERISGPLGGARIDIAAAIVATTVANANRSRRRPYKLDSFLPAWARPPRRAMSPEEMWTAVQRIHARLGGTAR